MIQQDFVSSIDANLYFYPSNIIEIRMLIKSLKPKDSSGLDEILNRMLIKWCDVITSPLTSLINKSLEMGTFPSQMKQAIIKPLYKNKSKLQTPNYRPISLLLGISKILEKVVYKRTIKFLNKLNVFYEGQYGFRANQSTQDAILDPGFPLFRNHKIPGFFK